MLFSVLSGLILVIKYILCLWNKPIYGHHKTINEEGKHSYQKLL